MLRAFPWFALGFVALAGFNSLDLLPQAVKGGLIVEQGPVRQVLREPAHEYTRTLLESVPDLVAPQAA